MKRISSFVCALMFIILGLSFTSSNLKVTNAKSSSYLGTTEPYEIFTKNIYFDTYEEKQINIDRLCPNYQTSTQTNSCSPVAGAIIVGYYDYECPNLIPNFEPGSYRDGVFKYRGHTAKIDTLIEDLYNSMGTNTINPGTSVKQFKNGLTSYAKEKGYSTSFSSCGTNLDSILDCFENEQPVVLFLSEFDYYPEMGFSKEDGKFSLMGKSFNVGHTMVAFGYKEFNFFTNGSISQTEKFLLVSFGDGTQGFLSVNSLSGIDEAFGVKIY